MVYCTYCGYTHASPACKYTTQLTLPLTTSSINVPFKYQYPNTGVSGWAIQDPSPRLHRYSATTFCFKCSSKDHAVVFCTRYDSACLGAHSKEHLHFSCTRCGYATVMLCSDFLHKHEETGHQDP